jgi:CspA family cold shock protein
LNLVSLADKAWLRVIKEEGVEKDHFVHASGLIDRIDENDKVEFELEEGPKGLSAVNVKKID